MHIFCKFANGTKYCEYIILFYTERKKDSGEKNFIKPSKALIQL